MSELLLAHDTKRCPLLKPMFVHVKPSDISTGRFDDLIMPNGTVAVLSNISRRLLGEPGLAIDEAYPGSNSAGREHEMLMMHLHERIEAALHNGDEPIVLCTVLSYNAEGSLKLLKDLKKEYGDRIRTGVGGQLTRVRPEAYLTKPYLDHIAVGDAEETLADIFRGRRYAKRYLPLVSQATHYAPPLYDNYIGLRDRLDEMSRYKIGPFSGIRQLIVESVRGCAWAYEHGICKFCSLEGVELKGVFRDFSDHIKIERELVEQFGINWVFDVSSQWLPTMRHGEMVTWLKSYIQARRDHGAPALNRYVYLTTNSITTTTAPLLREAGVRVAFVGIDGWDKATKIAHGKTLVSSDRMFKACRDNGLYVRAGLVLGSGLTPRNLKGFTEFVKDMVDCWGDTLLTFGVYLLILLPGSPIFDEFEKTANAEGINEALDLYAKFRSEGFFSWDDQYRLSEIYMRHTQREVAYEDILAVRDQAVEIARRSPHTITYTYDDRKDVKHL